MDAHAAAVRGNRFGALLADLGGRARQMARPSAARDIVNLIEEAAGVRQLSLASAGDLHSSAQEEHPAR